MATLYENFLAGTITDNPLLVGATSVNSSNFATLPTVASPDIMYIVLDPEATAGAPEALTVTTHTASATVCTVTRAAQGTTAREHAAGTVWRAAFTKADADQLAAIIADGAIDTVNLADGAVTLAKMDTNSVDTTQLVDDAVTLAKMDINSVGTDQIVDDNVTNAKIGPSAVGTTEIADSAVTSAKIAANTIAAGDIAANAVGSSELADSAVDTNAIQNSAVTTAKIAPDAVNGTKIADNSINSEHYVDGSIDNVHLAGGITGSKIASNTLTASNIAANSINTSELNADAVTGATMAPNTATRVITIQPGYRAYNNAGPHSTGTAYLVDLPTTINGISLTGIVGIMAQVSVTENGGNGNLRVYENGTTAPTSHSFLNYGTGGYPIFCSGGFIPTDSSGRFRLYPQTSNCGRIVVDVFALVIDSANT